MPERTPAEVMTDPVSTKRSPSTHSTSGWERRSPMSPSQCEVARRPSSRPASAMTPAPTQTLSTRGAPSARWVQPVEDLVGAAVDLGDDDDVGRAPELSVELGEGEVGDDVETTGERDRVRGRRDHDRVEPTDPLEHLERDEGVGDVGALLTEDDRDDRSDRVDGAGLGQSGRPVAATLAVGSAITAVSPEVARSRCGVDAGGRSRDGDRGRQRRDGQGHQEHDESATQRPQRTVHDPMVRPGGPCHQTFDAHASRRHSTSSRTVDHPRLCTASLNRPAR